MVGAGTDMTLRAVVLAVVLARARGEPCPAHCECAPDGYSCSAANGTVSVHWKSLDELYPKLTITCEGSNITCDDLPKLDYPYYLFLLNVESCPPSVLPCMKHVVEKPLSKNVALYYMSEPLTREHVADLTRVKKLELYLSGADTSLPTAAINSLTTLSRLYIYEGNLQRLPSNIFNQTTVDFLHLRNNNITSLPVGFFNGLSNLNELTIWYNNIESISVGAFKGLEKLEKLYLSNLNLKSIQAGTFSDTPNLVQLDLVDNPLQALPNELLQPMPRLKYITMVYNSYRGEMSLGSRAFARLPSLQMLMVNSYGLGSLSDYLFDGSQNIKTIYLINTSINGLSRNTFSKLFSLETLILRNRNNIAKLPEGVFKDLTSLVNLDFNNNMIQDIPERTFDNLRSLEEINLQYNKIQKLPDGMFNNLPRLKTLMLGHNNLRTLQPNMFRNLTSLITLSLSHNSLYELPFSIFHNLSALRKLELNNNDFEELPLHSFNHLRESLEDLNLSNNKIVKLDVFHGLSHSLPRSSFSDLIKLKYLDLSGNQLRRFYDKWELMTPQLRLLGLANNYLKSIEDFNVDFTKLNVKIKLQNNNISNIVLEPLTPPANVSRPATSRVELDGNPISCDCNSYGLYQRLNGFRSPHEPQYVLQNSTCITPAGLRGLPLKDISPSHLTCDVPKHCPNNCSCFARAASNDVIVNCSRVPATLPELTSNDFPYKFVTKPTITLKLKHQPNSIEGLNISSLILSHNQLNNITFMPPKSLKTVDLSYNNLTTIPDSFFSKNLTLYLSNNIRLECDCSFVEKWQTSGLVGDLEQVTCASGENLEAIDVYRLCNRTPLIIGLVAKCAIGVVLCLVVVKTVYQHWHYIAEVLCRRRSRHLTRLEKKLDEAKQFDLFISFAHPDTKFVTDNLLPKLENEFNQKVCVHFRDWIAGELIADQIIQSVESARRTIIVLSADFLLSEWSYLEFRTAHNLSIQEGKPRVIIILLKEDIVNDERLTNDFKSYIAVNTYLLWEDPNFWTKMKEVLPRKGRK